MKISLEQGYLSYELLGSGIPLLLIHGYPLSRKIWEPQLKALSDQATVITLDLRGHGYSYPFEGPYTMDMLAKDCKTLLDHLQNKYPIVVGGLSMGGYVLMAMYRIYPDIFKGMVLTSTRAGADTPEGKTNRDAAIMNAYQKGAGFIADTMLHRMFSPSTISSNPYLVSTVRSIMENTSLQGMVGALQGMRDRSDSTSLLTQINCPVLLIHGTDDPIIPMHEVEAMQQQIHHSRLVKINNAGHLPNLEQPDKYNQAVRDFLKSLN